MKRVFYGTTLADTAHLQNLLEQAGIGCFIKNKYLGAAVGELPVFDVAPELWVYRDEDAARASAVIRDALRPHAPASGAPWACAVCGEINEPQFAACWRCGASDERSGE